MPTTPAELLTMVIQVVNIQNWNKDAVFTPQISVETQPEWVSFLNASGDGGGIQTSVWRWLIFSDRFLGRRKQVAVCCCCGMCYICLSTVQLPSLVKAVLLVIMIQGTWQYDLSHNSGLTIMRQQRYTWGLYCTREHFLALLPTFRRNQSRPKFRIFTTACCGHSHFLWVSINLLFTCWWVKGGLNREWRRVEGGGVSTSRADGVEKWEQCKGIHSRSLIETKTLQYASPSPCDLCWNHKLPEESISQTERQHFFVVRADLWFFNPHFGMIYTHSHFLRYEIAFFLGHRKTSSPMSMKSVHLRTFPIVAGTINDVGGGLLKSTGSEPSLSFVFLSVFAWMPKGGRAGGGGGLQECGIKKRDDVGVWQTRGCSCGSWPEECLQGVGELWETQGW